MPGPSTDKLRQCCPWVTLLARPSLPLPGSLPRVWWQSSSQKLTEACLILALLQSKDPGMKGSEGLSPSRQQAGSTSGCPSVSSDLSYHPLSLPGQVELICKFLSNETEGSMGGHFQELHPSGNPLLVSAKEGRLGHLQQREEGKRSPRKPLSPAQQHGFSHLRPCPRMQSYPRRL